MVDFIFISEEKIEMVKEMLMIMMCLLCTKCDYVNSRIDSNIVYRANSFQQIVKANRKRISESLFDGIYEGLEYPKAMQNMKFSSENTVKKLKEIYNEIEFYGEFKKGDLSLYDLYAEQYLRLLKGEVEYYDLEYGTYTFIYGYDFETVQQDEGIKVYLFDMDIDGSPELCLSDVHGTYFFKYIPDIGQHILWWRTSGGSFQIMGSRKVSQFSSKGSVYFTDLGKLGEEICFVSWAYYLLGGSKIYLVSLPTYANGIREEDLIEEMKNDGYYDVWQDNSGRGKCFFRVTENEYYEIIEPYEKALAQALKEKENYTFEPWIK